MTPDRRAAAAFELCRHRPYPFLLEGAGAGGTRGRFSWIGAAPQARLLVRGTRWLTAEPPFPPRRGRGDPLEAIGAFVEQWTARPGAVVAGYLGYDLGRLIVGRDLPRPAAARGDLPDAHLAAYPEATCLEHAAPESPEDAPAPAPSPAAPDGSSDLDRGAYRALVERALDHIRAGDIYQVNLSRRFSAPLGGRDPFGLYRRLQEESPAPYGAFLDLGRAQILSVSPELFLRVEGRVVETRPIKGTRPRGPTPAEDVDHARALRASAKDLAEHLMIVDLERNDLGRVARTGTVAVESLFEPYALPTLHHLESRVTATLRDGVGVAELLRATFPGGSITGAPKIRAMEIIGDLERAPRGPYCGAIGLFGPGASLVLSIAIRTAVIRRDQIEYRAGGGIVADSDPDAEFDETAWKAEAFFRALRREE